MALLFWLMRLKIVRFSTISSALGNREISFKMVYYGIIFFAVGLAQKVLIADSVAEITDAIFAHSPSELSTGASWLGGLTYSLQIYFDFSGYSSMAIGLGLILGFEFPRNFNFPYISQSITEFWRRWHISLSSWFRDYLYIPLGGNRGTKFLTYRNLFIVFLSTGVWHGAAWNFIFWGLFHGAFLVLERIKLKSILEAIPTPLRVLYTLLVVYIGWIFFRAPDFSYALSYCLRLFSLDEGAVTAFSYLDTEGTILILVGLLCSTPIVLHFMRKISPSSGYGDWNSVALNTKSITIGLAISTVLIIVSATKILSGSYSPFIYFRF